MLAVQTLCVGALASLAFGGALMPGPAHAQAVQGQADERRYDIPAGPLEATLNRLGRDAGVLITFGSTVTDGLRSQGVSGSHTVDGALRQALGGTGLIAVRMDGGGFALRAAPAGLRGDAPTLGAVTVTATAQRDARTEGSGSYQGGPSASPTGLRLSLRDTPQSVTVITRQQMDDQGSTSVADVMRQAAGITANNYDSDRWSFSARGFSVTNFQYDGVTKDYDGVYDWGATNSDMTLFDRVEIVKGATGLMSGTGDPSATVNFVRKRPTDTFAGSLTASAGSWSNARTELDLSGPLNASGSVRGRVVAAYQDKKTFLDHYQQDKTVFYGIVEADLAPGTTVSLGADYQHVDPKGSTWTGFPVFNSDGSRTNFDRSFNPAATWSRRELETRNLFATLQHRLSSDWGLKLTVNNEKSQHRSLLGSASGGNPDPVTGDGMYYFMGDFRGDRTQNTLNASLSGSYELGGRQHEAMFGAMWSNTRTDGPWADSLYPSLAGSIFQWTGKVAQPDFPPIASYNENRRQTGLNAATRLRPTDALSVILGARVSSVRGDDARSYFDGVTSPLTSSLKESGVVTPYAGVVYDLNDTTSVYGSYTSIFSPQTARDINRQYLPAVRGKSAEVGIKGEYLDGRLNASAALFRIEQDNVAEYVDVVAGESVYKAVKGVTSQGLEAEVNGQVAPGWNLQAGYTYARVRDAKGERVYGATLMASQPKHVVRLTSSYQLRGDLSGLTLGGGIDWQSAFFGKVYNPQLGDYAVVEQKGYALLNLMARYAFDKNTSAVLNIRNVTDKKYYSGFGLFDTGFYGEPRNVTLTVRYRF